MKKRTKQPSPSETLFNQYFNCVPVNIMQLSEIDTKIKQIILANTNVDDKMKELVNQYRAAPTI